MKKYEDKNLTLAQIQDEIEKFVQNRDRVVHKGSNVQSYRALHFQSEYGEHPICHIRSNPFMTTNPSKVDCGFCLRAMKELE